MNRSKDAAVLHDQNETGCDFCKETDQSWESGGAHDFRINGNGLFYYDCLFGWEGITVNYCPMCGRHLDGTLDNYRKSERPRHEQNEDWMVQQHLESGDGLAESDE